MSDRTDQLVVGFNEDPARSLTMPSRLYVAPEVLEDERPLIFWKSWVFVAHVSDLSEPGDYVTASIADQPVFVIRDRQGELRAFFNVCQHRGHLLLEGSGTVPNLIVCPYHAWAYDSDGTLKGARMSERMEAFDVDDFSLPSVRLEVMSGLVFVNLDPEASPMNEVYPGLAAEVAALTAETDELVRADRTTFEIAANWKNVGDNLLECYHCHAAHPDFVDLIDMDGYRNECFENWSVQSGPAREVNGVYELGDGERAFTSIYVWPNLSIGRLPGHRGVLTFQFWPIEAERTHQELTYYGPEPALSASETSAMAYFSDVLGVEDVNLTESVQVGLRSMGYDQGRFICIPDRPEISEHAVHHFHSMVLAALAR